MFKRIYILSLLIGFFACKKEEQAGNAVTITTPLITRLARTAVQAGDTLRIYGQSLAQKDCITEVFIHDRSCQVLNSTSDSLVVVVGTQTLSGIVKVTVSAGQQFQSTNGPVVAVNGTPVLQKFWPLYGMPGDTIALVTAHFSINNTDNEIYLLGQRLKIVQNNGIDSIWVEVPAAMGAGPFSWQTFHGPVFQTSDTFTLRQKSYPAATVIGWTHQDPAFTYVDTLLRGFDALASNKEYLQQAFDTALLYVQSDSRIYTIFLPANGFYYGQQTSLAAYLGKVKDRSYLYYQPLLTAIIPGRKLSFGQLQDGDIFKTAATQDVAFPGGDPNLFNQVQIVKENGRTYAFVVGIDGSTAPRVEILRSHMVGNACIMETNGELGSLPM
jgi:hypothetical protein